MKRNETGKKEERKMKKMILVLGLVVSLFFGFVSKGLCSWSHTVGVWSNLNRPVQVAPEMVPGNVKGIR